MSFAIDENTPTWLPIFIGNQIYGSSYELHKQRKERDDFLYNFFSNYHLTRDFRPSNIITRELLPEEKKQNHIETILLMSIPIILILGCLAAAIYAICTYSGRL